MKGNFKNTSKFSNADVLEQLTKLWSPSKQVHATPEDILGNKLVLLYFSAHWCGPCRRFTPAFSELYEKLKARACAEDFDVVCCSMDRTEDEYASYTGEMPWWCLPFKSPVMGKLANLYGAKGIPHLVILEKDGSVLVPDGVGEVSKDPEGIQFPWRPRPFVSLLPEQYLANDKTVKAMSELDDKYLMLYFSAHWCPPCRGFTPALSKAYTALKQQRDDFELLFISSDHDQSMFDQYFSEMSFCALPYEERQAKADIATRLQIRGIPSLQIFGPRPADGGDRPLINANVRSVIQHGDYLSDFPYKPKPYGDLNTTTADINNFRCVIIFDEAADSEEQEDTEEALKMAAERCPDKQVRFLWAHDASGLSKTVRNALKLGPITEKPTMVLLDIPDQGGFYTNEGDEITLESVVKFMNNPGTRKQI